MDFGFDGIKLDGCGEFRNLSVWSALLNQSGRYVTLSHWHRDSLTLTCMVVACLLLRLITGAFACAHFLISKRPVLIEDCHWGGDGPGSWGDGGALNRGPNAVAAADWQPSNFFRTCGDIGGSWDAVFENLQSVVRWQPWRTWSSTSHAQWAEWFRKSVRTGPGRWAYVLPLSR